MSSEKSPAERFREFVSHVSPPSTSLLACAHDPHVESFKERVLRVVRSIPPGQTMTYGAVAAAAGSPRAARVVGSLMAKNHDRTVPCHRVMRADGTPGNYNRGGPGMKLLLLVEEKRTGKDATP